jgi:leucyl/phenylalanyl-tRNA--protein transferase
VPVYRLTDQYVFPDPNDADESGLLAVGGDLHPKRLLLAYAQGIFPWPHGDEWPMLWFSPEPRMVLLPSDLHVSRSLRKTCNKGLYDIRFDSAFEQVIRACSATYRPNQDGTWVTPEMVEAYCRLHELGFAHSIEAWADGELTGGLYGISLGGAFFGESMFAHRSDASKVAFVYLVRQLQAWAFQLIDCQVYTEHLESFGAQEWPRSGFLRALDRARQMPTRRGRGRQTRDATEAV